MRQVPGHRQTLEETQSRISPWALGFRGRDFSAVCLGPHLGSKSSFLLELEGLN